MAEEKSQPRTFLGKQTPLTLIHAPHGSSPYLSMDIAPPALCYHVPIGELCPTETMQQYGKKGLHAFANLKGSSLFFSVRDPVLNEFGPANNETYSLSGQRGKKKLNCADYMAVMTTFAPDAFACMSDEIPAFASMSRASKSVTRSIAWLDECLKLHESANYNRAEKPLLFATIQGGIHESLRTRCAQEMAKRPVDGFVFGGLCAGESASERKAAILTMTAHLPPNKLRILQGLLNPVEIIEAVLLGIDVVDSPYPYVLTGTGCASTYSLLNDEEDGKKSSNNNNNNNNNNDNNNSSSNNKIQLRDKKFERDSSPLVAGCRCYTCSRHHRAYIHHLLNVHEMLAEILLMIHNMHAHLRLFDAIRTHANRGSLAAFASEFQKQFYS